MSTTIQATFTVDDWDERPILECGDAPKITQATVAKSYSGDIEGSSTTEWLMAYAEDGTATFVGVERVTATFGGDRGTLALRHVGAFEDGAAVAELQVVPGSGTGAMADAAGDGDFRADPQGTVTLRLSGAGAR
jgi:Protein of unknown function (DUF3224)